MCMHAHLPPGACACACFPPGACACACSTWYMRMCMRTLHLVHVHMYTCMCARACVHVAPFCAHRSVHVCMCACACTRARACVRVAPLCALATWIAARVHTRAHASARWRMHIYMHMHTGARRPLRGILPRSAEISRDLPSAAHIHMHMHTCTHAHMHAPVLAAHAEGTSPRHELDCVHAIARPITTTTSKQLLLLLLLLGAVLWHRTHADRHRAGARGVRDRSFLFWGGLVEVVVSTARLRVWCLCCLLTTITARVRVVRCTHVAGRGEPGRVSTYAHTAG